MEVAFRHVEEQLVHAMEGRRFTPWSSLYNRVRGESRSLAKGFDRLLALEELDVRLYDHQHRAVLRVLQHMRGRALLADEVGLGKTIEAGIVLKEYIVRGLAKKVLILVPATLTEQWRAELDDKLFIDARINRDVDGWERFDCIIASLDTAKRPEHAARIHSVSWDMVIVDEAHRLKNRQTAAWRFVDQIRKKYLLLLTATPIQNDLEELYNMMTLLKPGLLQTYTAFKHRFMLDKRSPKHVERLREHVRDVMIRSARTDCAVPFPKRVVETVPVRQTDEERAFYDDVLAFARRVYGQGGQRNVLPLILLLRELCSSPAAARRTLLSLQDSAQLAGEERAAAGRLAARAARLVDGAAKLDAASTLIRRHGEPMILFTQFRATQDALYDALSARGVPVVRFHGGMSDEQRRRAIDTFRSHGGVLLSTEAGGEGQNLQFCRTVLNYDLPWNPMRVEQRIGRVHRLGQSRDVVIINLYTEDTIETFVYRLLHDKIRLFQQVIGDLELILTVVAGDDGNGSLETTVGKLVLQAADDDTLTDEFADVGERLAQARHEREEVQRLNERAFGAMASGEDDDVSVNARPDGGHRRSKSSEDVETPADGEDDRTPLAELLHPLCLDVNFARGVLTESATHPVVTAMHHVMARLQFANVRSRVLGRRLVHQRHVLFWFKVAYRSDETRETLHEVLLDPVTEQARAVPDLQGAVDVGPDVTGADANAHNVGTYVLRRLYRRACRHVNDTVLRRGRAHQAEARMRLARDKTRLEAYYEGRQAEALAPIARDLRRLEAVMVRERLARSLFAASGDAGERSNSAVAEQLKQFEHEVRNTMDALTDEQRRRVEELERKYAVRAEVTGLAAALLWVPRVELRYKLLGHARREILFYYDPLQDAMVGLDCDGCGQPMVTVYACTDGDLVCAECYGPCASCDAPLCRGCLPRRCHACDSPLCDTCDSACPKGAPGGDTTLHVCRTCREHVCSDCTVLSDFLVV